MSKKKKKIQETTIENYYDLRVDKVDELVAALKGDDEPKNNEEVNYEMNANMGVDDPENVTRSGKQKKFDPYKVDKLSRVPVWIKALFVKWWFAGAVCYFMMLGLSIGNDLDRVVLTGAVLGLIVDLFVNPVFRYMESDVHEYNDYMMFPFPFKKFWTLFANLIYYILLMGLVSITYTGINELINYASGTENLMHVAVEPLLFGIIVVIVDMVFIGIKDGFVHLAKHLKKKKEGMANA